MGGKKDTLMLILAGAAAGLCITFYAAGLFVLFLFLLCLLAIKIFIRTESRDFLIKLFIISFILRALFCFVNYNAGLRQPFWGGDTQPDAAFYNGNAFYISHLLKGDNAGDHEAMVKNPFLTKIMKREGYYYKYKLPPVEGDQIGRYTYLLGIFYVWLGYAPIAAKMISSLFCCMSIVAVYLIARQLFGEEPPSRHAAAIFAFFPSIFYWSVTGLRDSIFNFLVLLYLLFVVKFITKRNYWYTLFALLTIYFSNSFRTSISAPLLAGLGAVVIIDFITAVKVRGSRPVKILLFLCFCLIFAVLVLCRTVVISKIADLTNRVARVRVSKILTADISSPLHTSYRIFSAQVYRQEILTAGDIFSFRFPAAVFKAIIYLFFSPFPFGNWTLNFLPFYPQIIYWYLMVPFVVAGWLLFLKKDKYGALALAFFFFILVLPISLYENNIGTAFRHKDMFMPIAFVFAAYAFTRPQTGCGRA